MSNQANWCHHGVREPDVCDECLAEAESRLDKIGPFLSDFWKGFYLGTVATILVVIVFMWV